MKPKRISVKIYLPLMLLIFSAYADEVLFPTNANPAVVEAAKKLIASKEVQIRKNEIDHRITFFWGRRL